MPVIYKKSKSKLYEAKEDAEVDTCLQANMIFEKQDPATGRTAMHTVSRVWKVTAGEVDADGNLASKGLMLVSEQGVKSTCKGTPKVLDMQFQAGFGKALKQRIKPIAELIAAQAAIPSSEVTVPTYAETTELEVPAEAKKGQKDIWEKF